MYSFIRDNKYTFFTLFFTQTLNIMPYYTSLQIFVNVEQFVNISCSYTNFKSILESASMLLSKIQFLLFEIQKWLNKM